MLIFNSMKQNMGVKFCTTILESIPQIKKYFVYLISTKLNKVFENKIQIPNF